MRFYMFGSFFLPVFAVLLFFYFLSSSFMASLVF